MKRLILLICIILSFRYANGQEFNETYGSPVIVLIETDPWLMVIGSDVPTFALYENGQIIYRKIVNKRYKFFEITHTKEETQKIIKTFGITDSLMNQPNYIEASYATDQPTNELLLNFDSLKVIRVYGSLQYDESPDRKKTPNCFLKVYDSLKKFEDKDAKEWLPDQIEVMLTNYSYSPEKPLEWPSGWPDLNSPATVKRGEDLYSVYLDKKYFHDFIKLAGKLKEKQPVEVNDQKFSVSYRLPFPNIR